MVKTSKHMKELLHDIFEVKEEHPMMALFLDGDVLLADLTKQCKEILKILYNTLFKKGLNFVAANNTTNIGPQEDEHRWMIL